LSLLEMVLEMFLDTIEGCVGVDDEEFNNTVDLLDKIKQEKKKFVQFEDIKL
jgi:predicted AAA+ superfamily ATPase